MLNFPNRSRIFDPTRRAVRFWGYDSAMEWSFFATEEALKRLQPTMEQDEASLLLAFDTNRLAIHAAAIKAYKGEREKGRTSSWLQIFDIARDAPLNSTGIALIENTKTFLRLDRHVGHENHTTHECRPRLFCDGL